MGAAGKKLAIVPGIVLRTNPCRRLVVSASTVGEMSLEVCVRGVCVCVCSFFVGISVAFFMVRGRGAVDVHLVVVGSARLVSSCCSFQFPALCCLVKGMCVSAGVGGVGGRVRVARDNACHSQ